MSKPTITPEMKLAATEAWESTRGHDWSPGYSWGLILEAALAVAPEHPAVTLLRKIEGDADICPICNVDMALWHHRPSCELSEIINPRSLQVDLAPTRRTPVRADVVADPSKTVGIEAELKHYKLAYEVTINQHDLQYERADKAETSLKIDLAAAIRERDEARAERDDWKKRADWEQDRADEAEAVITARINSPARVLGKEGGD